MLYGLYSCDVRFGASASAVEGVPDASAGEQSGLLFARLNCQLMGFGFRGYWV